MIPPKDTDAGPARPAHNTPEPIAPAFRVRRVPVGLTLALRREVLGVRESPDQLAFPGDEDPTTASFAAFDPEDNVLSVARVSPETAPFPTDALTTSGAPAQRLRGMATRSDARNRGIGSAVLQAVIAHVGSQGGGVLWCNARVPAVRLYLRAGFMTHGEEWVDPAYGPHVVMWLRVP